MTTPFDDLLPKLPKEVALAAKECWEACKDSKVGDWMSHIHHAQWLEILDEPVENRIRFILENKDPKEHVERLRRLRPFDISKATPECKKMLAAFKKADTALDKALAALDKAWDALDRVQAAYDSSSDKEQAALNKAHVAYDKAWNVLKEIRLSPEMTAVHAKVCDCPWNKNTDIFGKC